jgi:hypothetical protein
MYLLIYLFYACCLINFKTISLFVSLNIVCLDITRSSWNLPYLTSIQPKLLLATLGPFFNFFFL